MSYLGDSNREVTRRKDVMSGYSLLSDDSSCPEDLLARLYDFPHVPGDVPHHVEMFPLAVHQTDDHTSAKRSSSSVASLVIDTTSEAEHDALPSGEGDPTTACLRASQILRAHPGLVMEHYDPTTSVHTFKIAYHRPQQDEDPLLPSPATPSLSNSSSDSSPLTPYMQTPPFVPLRRFRSVSSSSRDPFDSRIAAGGLHRVAHSMSSSTSDSPDSVLRHHPPLRRTASELSERSPTVGSRYGPRQSEQAIPSSVLPLSSYLSASTHSSAAERVACVTGTSPEPGDGPPPPSPDLYSCMSNDSRSCSDTFMSSDELLAFREFLAQRREDVLTEARNLGTSLKMDRHPYSLGGLREDAVGDCSEREESITSGRHLGVHQPGKIRNVACSCNPPCSNTTSVSTVLGFLDGTSTKEDLLRALSIIRAERAQVASDDGSLLAGSDTFLDFCARSSSPASKRQLESPSYGYLQVPHSQHGVSPRSQLTDLSSPAATYATSVEEIQDFLPDFLDLHSDGDPSGSGTNEMSSGSGSLRLLVQDERLAPVPEGSAAYLSQERNSLAAENNQPDPQLASPLPGTLFGAQRKQSAAELVSGHSPLAHPFVSSQSYSQSRSADGDFKHINPYDRRGNHQASPVSATVAVTAEDTGGSYPRRVYDNGKGPLAEYAEMAYSQSVVESDGPRSDGSYYSKRVQDDPAGVSRHGKLGLPMAVRSSSPRDFQPREVGRVVQRPRAMTVQEVSVSGSATSDRLHRSASATASTSSTSSSSRRRYRTLSDRAYRHPDVPHSPLFSDLDHPPLPQGGYYTISTPRGAFSSHHIDYRHVSPSETSSTPLFPSRSPYPGEVSSRNTSPRPPRPRPQMPHGHGRNGSHPVRPHQPAQPQVRRTGSTPDLRRGASTPSIQSSTQGVGLSLIDNGAFEAPRPAPEPRTHAENKPGLLPSRTARRGPPAALKIPAEDDETPASYLVIADSPPAFSALSFRRHVRSKKQKQPPRSDSPGGGHLRPTGSSESDLNSSFFSILESDAKPQRRGLFFKKKT